MCTYIVHVLCIQCTWRTGCFEQQTVHTCTLYMYMQLLYIDMYMLWMIETHCVLFQGLLDLEGSLASVRTHLVKRDQHATDLLDTSNGADDIIRRYSTHGYELRCQLCRYMLHCTILSYVDLLCMFMSVFWLQCEGESSSHDEIW